jgi:hypothetical protein
MNRRLSAIILAQEYARKQQQKNYYNMDVTYDESAGTATMYVSGSEHVNCFQITIDKTFKLHIKFERQSTMGSHHPYIVQFGEKYIPQYSNTEMLISEIWLLPEHDERTTMGLWVSQGMYSCAASKPNAKLCSVIPVAVICDVMYEMASKLGLQVKCEEGSIA